MPKKGQDGTHRSAWSEGLEGGNYLVKGRLSHHGGFLFSFNSFLEWMKLGKQCLGAKILSRNQNVGNTLGDKKKMKLLALYSNEKSSLFNFVGCQLEGRRLEIWRIPHPSRTRTVLFWSTHYWMKKWIYLETFSTLIRQQEEAQGSSDHDTVFYAM